VLPISSARQLQQLRTLKAQISTRSR
jgi:hypothetical protein